MTPASARRSLQANSRSRGFTLLEVLLALVLILGMIGGLLAFYRYATEVRQIVQEEARNASTHRRLMDRLTSELRGATVSPSLGLTLNGGPDRIQFLTTALPKPGVWDVKESDAIQPTPTQDLRVISYDLRTWIDDENVTHIDGIECIWKTTLLPKYSEENEGDPSVLMTPEYQFLHFRYFDGAAWNDTWGGATLPVAVEVTIGHAPLPDGTEPAEYPFDTHQRTIFIPGSGSAPPPLRMVRTKDTATTQPDHAADDPTTQPAGGTP